MLNGRVCPRPAKVLKGRLARGSYEVLVQWLDQDATTAAWVPLEDFKRLYPDFQLEDELLLQGGERCYDGTCLPAPRQEDNRAGRREKWLK